MGQTRSSGSWSVQLSDQLAVIAVKLDAIESQLREDVASLKSTMFGTPLLCNNHTESGSGRSFNGNSSTEPLSSTVKVAVNTNLCSHVARKPTSHQAQPPAPAALTPPSKISPSSAVVNCPLPLTADSTNNAPTQSKPTPSIDRSSALNEIVSFSEKSALNIKAGNGSDLIIQNRRWNIKYKKFVEPTKIVKWVVATFLTQKCPHVLLSICSDFRIPNFNGQRSFKAAPKFGLQKTQVLAYSRVHEAGPTIEWIIAWRTNSVLSDLRTSRFFGREVLIRIHSSGQTGQLN